MDDKSNIPSNSTPDDNSEVKDLISQAIKKKQENDLNNSNNLTDSSDLTIEDVDKKIQELKVKTQEYLNNKENKQEKSVSSASIPNSITKKQEKNPTTSNKNLTDKIPQAKNQTSPKSFKKKRASLVITAVLSIIVMIAVVVFCIFKFYVNRIQEYHGEKLDSNYYQLDSGEGGKDTLDIQKHEEKLLSQYNSIKDATMSDEDVINILVIGEDIRDTEQVSRGNTDVMILISINTKAKTFTMTSFMRDIYLQIPNYGANRLNMAYSLGGPELLFRTIQDNFGIEVDKYVLFDFYSFIDVIEAVGGVNITLSDEEAEGMKAPMAEQNHYLKNKKGTDYLDKGGSYLLNGNQALAYARLRYVGNADYERTQRQRKVISEIISQAKKLSFTQLNNLMLVVTDHIKSNLDDGEIAYLLVEALGYMNYDIQQLRIPADNTFYDARIRGMDVLCPYFNQNIALLQETIYGSTNVDTSDDISNADFSSNNYTFKYFTKRDNLKSSSRFIDEYQVKETSITQQTEPPQFSTDDNNNFENPQPDFNQDNQNWDNTDNQNQDNQNWDNPDNQNWNDTTTFQQPQTPNVENPPVVSQTEPTVITTPTPVATDPPDIDPITTTQPVEIPVIPEIPDPETEE